MNKLSSSLSLPSLGDFSHADVLGFETVSIDLDTGIITNSLVSPIDYAQDIVNDVLNGIASTYSTIEQLHNFTSQAGNTFATINNLNALINELNFQLDTINSNFQGVSDFLGLTISQSNAFD